MINNTNTNDWFAAVLLNPNKDYQNFKDVGFTANNTGILSKNEYRNLSKVQEIFKN
jgi:hypothetical protein